MNQIKTLGLLALLSGLLVTIGYAIGGSGGALIGLIFAAVTNLFSWYSSDKIALAAYKAQPLAPDQAPEYLVPSNGANAFATGRDPEHAAVAVTQGIVKMLSAEEIEAVIAHELSHIKNRDTLTQAVAATVAGGISYMAQVMQFGMMFGGGSRDRQGGNPLGAIAAIVLAPIAASVIQMAISRTREFEADAGAARLTRNPRALASALQRLEAGARQMPVQANPAFEPLLIINPFSGQFLSGLFATHPSTEARIQNLLKLEQELGASPDLRALG
jgi:heat shock protein HtpX